MGQQYDMLTYLRGLNMLSILLRFSLAVLCGGVIGMERGKKRHAAGLRTHLVVCIGSAGVMMVSQYISLFVSPNADPARLGAQVISGIGFLGVGTIVITGRQQVKGLTTAAGLWASACMGLAIGVGFYEGAIIMCVFLYMVLEVLNRLDERYLKTAVAIQLYFEYDNQFRFSAILCCLRCAGWRTSNIEYLRTGDATTTSMLISATQNDKKGMPTIKLIEKLRSAEGVLFVEEM